MFDTAKREKHAVSEKEISPGQARDTGMAMVLICLLAGYFWKIPEAVLAGILFHVVNMAFPLFFRPMAGPWLGLSHILGSVLSRILLSLIFFALVTPVGVVRRISGADPLKLRQWKQGRSSVFRVREHRYRSEDMEKPY